MVIKITLLRFILIVLLVLGALFGYGMAVGHDHNTNGVSVFQAGITAASMNPISRQGYLVMIRQNQALMDRVQSLREK